MYSRMNKCLHCGKEVKNKYCNVSCQNSHQNIERSILVMLRRKGALKSFVVICEKCKKVFSVAEREKLFPTKSKYYCSRSCANSRVWSDAQKEKIRKITKKFHLPYVRKCPTCNKELLYKNNSRLRRANLCKSLCWDCRVREFKNTGHFSKMGRKSVESQSKVRRSKNEIYFSDLCKQKFFHVETNLPLFNGWDADVIVHDKKIAVLWNGVWHRKKIKEKHSLAEVQNRDKIKIKEIVRYGYIPYVIEDEGKENKDFVELEFQKFCDFLV